MPKYYWASGEEVCEGDIYESFGGNICEVVRFRDEHRYYFREFGQSRESPVTIGMNKPSWPSGRKLIKRGPNYRGLKQKRSSGFGRFIKEHSL